MWSKQSIENDIDKTLMELDFDCVPKEQRYLLRNFEMREKGQITDKEKNKLDHLLLSDNKEDVAFGIKLMENKMKRYGIVG